MQWTLTYRRGAKERGPVHMAKSDCQSDERVAPQRRTPARSLVDLLNGSPVIGGSPESKEAAAALAADQPRRTGIPVRKVFVRTDSEQNQPPMSRLYRGGRSGVVAVRLYLALIWKSSGGDFDSNVPARAWATLLDLEDPEGRGQRRITRALAALEELNLVTITRDPGKVPRVVLLDEGGSGSPYRPPVPNAQTREDVYFRVPTKLWKLGYIQTMSGPALVVLLILLAEQADRADKTVWFGGSKFDEWFWISHKTRTEGVKELVQLGLLSVGRQPVATKAGPMAVFASQRIRHTYRLTGFAVPDRTSAVTNKAAAKASPTKAPATKSRRSRPRRPNGAARTASG